MLRYSTTLKSDEIDSIAIGGFDGMHKGHMALVDRLSNKGVILVIDKGISNLTPDDSRCKYAKNGCVFLKLEDLKDLKSYEFVNLLEREFINLKKIVVGYDFAYGKNRTGDVKKLKDEFSGEVVVVDEVRVGGDSVHSAKIREYIEEKNIKKANIMLEREYTIEAKSIRGQGIGKKELVATINLDVRDYLLPYEGVYATKTKVEGIWYRSVTFIGVRSSTDNKNAVETHLIDNSIDFFPSRVRVKFISYIRENRKFESLKDLKEQIKKDIVKARDDTK